MAATPGGFSGKALRVDLSTRKIVVVEGISRKVALIVDDVISQQQVVIKSIGSGLRRTRYVSGAAILPDGAVGLILNVDEIAAARHDHPDAAGASDETGAEASSNQQEVSHVIA